MSFMEGLGLQGGLTETGVTHNSSKPRCLLAQDTVERCSWLLFFFDFLKIFFGATPVLCEDIISTLSDRFSHSS